MQQQYISKCPASNHAKGRRGEGQKLSENKRRPRYKWKEEEKEETDTHSHTLADMQKAPETTRNSNSVTTTGIRFRLFTNSQLCRERISFSRAREKNATIFFFKKDGRLIIRQKI